MEPNLSSSNTQHLLEEQPPTTTTKSRGKLALIPLVFLIFFEVSGGPYGEESAVGAAGPLWAILGFLIFPFIWSIPEALITAELATAFPGNGGFVIWAHQAFGPFWGSLMGSWKFLTGVLNLASYPVLCIDYLKLVFPVFSSGVPRYIAIASTLAGEVEQPQKNFPIALLSAGVLTCLGYLVPLLAATGAIPLSQVDWTDGYFAYVAEMVAGKWLKFWMEAGACLSVIGLYEAQLSSCAYQVLGMADLGFLPQFFGMRSKWFNTPWVAILVSTVIALAGCYMDFADIISSVNFLYSLGMLLEFASFLWLRRKMPSIDRPFRVPMGLPGLIIMCLIPSVFLVYVMAVATRTVYMVSFILTVLGIFMVLLHEVLQIKDVASI
ncbi:hypothetical protein OIU76_017088 [Salix suchowensis]|nr:hypothetical protein OIU76_017088 [Salix suchowensis]